MEEEENNRRQYGGLAASCIDCLSLQEPRTVPWFNSQRSSISDTQVAIEIGEEHEGQTHTIGWYSFGCNEFNLNTCLVTAPLLGDWQLHTEASEPVVVVVFVRHRIANKSDTDWCRNNWLNSAGFFRHYFPAGPIYRRRSRGSSMSGWGGGWIGNAVGAIWHCTTRYNTNGRHGLGGNWT